MRGGLRRALAWKTGPEMARMLTWIKYVKSLRTPLKAFGRVQTFCLDDFAPNGLCTDNGRSSHDTCRVNQIVPKHDFALISKKIQAIVGE